MTPALFNPLIVTLPEPSICILSTALVSNERVFAVAAEKPVLVLPLNLIDGKAAVPAGIVSAPVIVSPDLSTLSDAAPVTVPTRFAVIVPAEKLPATSRATIAFAVFAFVAVVAEFATFPAVLIVASLVSTIAAVGSISVLTIKDVDKLPNESLCTMPVVLNPLIETTPLEAIFNRSSALVLNDKLLVLAERPVVVLPVNVKDGNAVDPAGSCKAPVIVSPAFATLPLICV